MEFVKTSGKDPIKEDRDYYRSLSRKMLVTVVVVSFMPLIFVSGVTYYHFQSSYIVKVKAHLESLVNRHKQIVDTFLTERRSNLHQLASLYSVDELSNENFLQGQLDILRKEYGQVFTDIGIVDHTGHQVAYAGPFKLGHAMYTDAPWFGIAMSNDIFMSDVFLGLRGAPHFIVTARLFKDNMPWILRATIDFQAFNNLVSNIRIGRTGMAFIINKSGELQTYSPFAITDAASGYSDVMDKAFSMKDGVNIMGFGDDDINGNQIIASGLLNKGNWALIYQQNKNDALYDVKRAWIFFLIFITLGGISIITMAIFVSKRMVDRIKKADREKDLMNQQVIESGRLASLGELAAGIAHEINNPVAIMVEEAGWIEDLLLEEDLSRFHNLDELKRALSQIRKQGLRCRDITHKLLSFARRTDSENQIVDLNAMVKEVTELFTHQAKFQNSIISANYGDNMPFIHASHTEVQQILFNFIINSLDALEGTGGKIDITTSYENNTFIIHFKDNGPGIPKVHLARIFDPFFTTKPVGKGTGLGLSICYGIVKKLGGEISVKSAIGAGAEFTVTLPDEKNENTATKTNEAA